MADLRDQLLRAGLIDQKTKQQADTAARRKRKKKNKKGQAVSTSDRQRQAYDDRIAAEAEDNRHRDAERNREREERELRNRVASLAGTWAVREQRPGPRRFCYVSRERKILWFDLSAALARKLELGLLAIVERPGDADEPHAVVPARIAARIERLSPECVRFWNREPVGSDPPEQIPPTAGESGRDPARFVAPRCIS
jgi:uncharacterized protein YaiL (DUF2058 family)